MAELLKELADTIHMVRDRANAHTQYFSEGHHAEWRTRIGLIDPILHALGWDVSNPTLVEIEPQTKSGRPDYALLGSNRKALIYLEAKNLSVTKPPTDQVLNYVVSENMNNPLKIGYCAWTNGNEWEVYDVFNQNSVMELSIKKEDASKCALKFLGLWRCSLQDGGFDLAVQPLVEVGTDTAPEPAPQAEVEPVPQPKSTQSAAQYSGTTAEGEWTPLTGEFATMGNPPPKAIKFQDGTERLTKYWFEILRQTALHLVEAKLLTRENCQIRSSTAGGSTRYLFSLDGKHSNGKAFAFPVPLGDTGIIVEANFSALDSVRQAKRLLEHFGLDPARVALKLS